MTTKDDRPANHLNAAATGPAFHVQGTRVELLLLKSCLAAWLDEATDTDYERSSTVGDIIEGQQVGVWEIALDAPVGYLSAALAEAEAGKVAVLEGEVERLRERVTALQNDHLRAIRAGRELRATDEHAGVMAVLVARTAYSVERNDALWVNPFEAQHLLAALRHLAAAQAERELGSEESISKFILELVAIIGRRDIQEMRHALERSSKISLEHVSGKIRTEYGLVISDLFAALATAQAGQAATWNAAPLGRWLHEKSSRSYDGLGIALVQTSTGPLYENDQVMVYRGPSGAWFVRRLGTDFRARFALVPTDEASQ